MGSSKQAGRRKTRHVLGKWRRWRRSFRKHFQQKLYCPLPVCNPAPLHDPLSHLAMMKSVRFGDLIRFRLDPHYPTLHLGLCEQLSFRVYVPKPLPLSTFLFTRGRGNSHTQDGGALETTTRARTAEKHHSRARRTREGKWDFTSKVPWEYPFPMECD